MPGSAIITELRRDYRKKRPAIEKRLAEFRRAREKGDRAIFEELCYCILTAGSSARMGMRTVEALRDLLHDGSEAALQKRAQAHRVRFWRLRPSYIVRTREYLTDACDMRLCTLLDSFADPQDRRDFFAGNKAVKGLGYKEASHFLRNIGYPGYAILDKHILHSLQEFGVIRKSAPPSGRAAYLAAEEKLMRFARKIRIDPDHLDLLLWSRRTGEILK